MTNATRYFRGYTDTELGAALAAVDAQIALDRRAKSEDRVHVVNAKLATERAGRHALRGGDVATYRRVLATAEAFRLRGLDLPTLEFWSADAAFRLD